MAGTGTATQADPYASIATPTPAPTAGSDPYASIATPTPPQQGALVKTANAIGEGGAGIMEGAVQGMSNTIQSIPYLGKKLISPEAMAAERAAFAPKSTAEKVGQYGGQGLEGTLEFVLGDEALKGLSIAERIGLASKIVELSKTSPYLAKLMEHGANAARHGVVAGTETYAKGGTPTQALEAGGAAAGTSLIAQEIPGAAKGIKTLIGGAEDAPEGPGIVKRAVSPKAATQPGAQSALRAGAEASATDAGATVTNAKNAGIRTLMEKPIAEAAKIEDGLYKNVNDAAETDMKSLYDRREELQDAIEDPTNVTQKTALKKELTANEKLITKGEANVQTKLGKDASGLIDQAKAATQQRYAMETANAKIFNNESVVSGNVAHNGEESINVDAAIRQAENLDKPSKYAPRGTPTRLVQAYGEDGAKALKQGLYDAKGAGEKVLTRNAVIGILTTGGAGLYEFLKK